MIHSQSHIFTSTTLIQLTQLEHYLTLDEKRINTFPDEAFFHLSDIFNKQNLTYWYNENPHQLHKRLFHSKRAKVWCALSSLDIIGPHFSENIKRITSTAN